ncbi:hypothetical protein pb186bvf_005227 [Paramecium bursaria]
MKNQLNIEAQIRLQMQARIEKLIDFGNIIGGDRYDLINYIQTWLSYNADERSYELRQKGIYQQTDSFTYTELNVDQFHKMTTLFPNSLWNWRITSNDKHILLEKFAKFFKQSVDHVNLLSNMHLILLGHFQLENHHLIAINLEDIYRPLQCCMVSSVSHKYSMLFEIALEQYPTFAINGQFSGFTFRHTIIFFDIILLHIAQPKNEFNEITRNYLTKSNQKELQKVDQQQFERIAYDNFHLMKFDHRPLFKIKIEDLSAIPESKLQLDQTKCVYVPNQFKDIQYNCRNAKRYYFNEKLRVWLSIKDDLPVTKQDTSNNNQLKELMSKEIFKQFIDFKSAAELLQFVERIPNFKVKITQQEKQVIGASGNVLVIGRSGTGKTTCTILRLFATELLFKLRVNLQMQNLNQFYNMSGDSVDSKSGLRCVFVTASPVLVNEVKKYYNNITFQIKQQLEKKKQKKLLLEQQKQKESQKQQDQNLEQSQFQIINQDQELELEFLEQQMKDIKIEELNQDESDDSDFEEEEERFNKELNKFESFDQMTNQDFPAFLTIRKLIFMIDSSLDKPFMTSYRKSQIRNRLDEWHNESQGVVRIQKSDQDDIDEDVNDEIRQNNQEDQMDLDEQEQQAIEFERKSRLNKIRRLQNTANFKEINFELFLERFWPTLFYSHKKKNIKRQFSKISPALLWTHIYSYIKGSRDSHIYQQQYLPLAKYLQIFKDQSIDENLLQRIYNNFEAYEKWKNEKKYYDLMDIVNHILHQIHNKEQKLNQKQKIQKINFLMIDEVQDLPHAMLELFGRITDQNLFLCGDTAQNIAKGVGFRFQDLKSLFANKVNQNNKFTTFQLTTNFRSHNNILQIANSIVGIIQIFFPKTIDKLSKETSDLDGPKPMIIHSQESLFLFLKGNKQSDNIEFGSNQVIIVRDQHSKKKVPQILSHALILTIYEAKGLEFEDVILFNFFQDNDQSQWHLLQCLGVEDQFVDKEQFNNKITRHNKQQLDDENEDQNENENIFGFKEVDGKYIIKRLFQKQNIEAIDIQNFSQLCDDLKQLYVAVTRPKNRLIMYDDNPFKRQYLQKLWDKMNIVDIVEQDQTPTYVEAFSVQTSKKDWKKQGINMFKNKFYLQAMKCFNLAEEQVWEIKSKANMMAEEGTKILQEIEDLYHGYMSKQNQKQNQTKKMKEKNRIFKEAAELFLQVKKPIQAAQCLYSAEEYQEAFKIYEENGWIKEAAEAAYQSGQYQQSGTLFLKAKDIVRALDSFEMIKDWDGVYNTLKQFSDSIDTKTKQGYLNKYLPIVLTQLQEQVGSFEIEKDKNEKQNDEVIDEQNEESSDSDKDQQKELEIVGDDEENFIENNSDDDKEQTQAIIVQDDKQMDQDDSEAINIMNSQVELNKQESDMQVQISDDEQEEEQEEQQNQQNKDKSESFIVNITKQSDSFQVDFKENEYEHLGIYDLDDQWLKQDNKSIIESIQSKKSDISDFSAISYAQIQNNPNMQLVQTKGDIFIQDSVMQQIIKWISIFSEEFKQQLIYQRSKSVHLHNKAEQEIDYMVDFILDLDLIDIKFVYLILDCLEEFKSYKLCIFVCNRYKLADKLGRYLVSLAASYSPLLLEPQKIDLLVLNSIHTRRQQVEKGLVASFAVHQILQNINPEFLRIKFDNEALTKTNSLGLDCYQQLLLLGFWKKITYQMQIKDAQSLCETFLDFLNWKNIHFINVVHQLQEQIDNELDKQEKINLQGQLLLCQKKQENCFKSLVTQQFYFEYPINQNQIEFSINTLEQLYLEMINQVSINDISWRKTFMRQELDVKIINLNIRKIKLPQFLYNTEILWNSILQNLQIPEEVISEIHASLTKHVPVLEGLNKVKMFEAALFVFLLLKYLVIYPDSEVGLQYSSAYSNETIMMIYDMIQLLQQSLRLNHQIVNQKTQLLLRAILLVFRTRIPYGVLFQNYKNLAFIQRNSILMHNVIEKQKKQNQQINSEFYFLDIDFDFVAVPIDLVLQVISNKLINDAQQLFSKRTSVLIGFYSSSTYLYDKLISTPENHQLVIKTLATILANKTNNIVDFDGPNMNQDGDILNRYEQLEKKREEQRQMEAAANQLGTQFDDHQFDENAETLLIQDYSKHNKQNILNEFLRQIIIINGQDLNQQTVTHKLVGLGLSYLQRAIQNPKRIHNDMIKGIIILNFLRLNHLSIMCLDSQVEKYPHLQSYYKYIEYLVCLKYNIISDAADCYMQYLDEYYDNIKIDEMAINLSKILVMQLISLNKQAIYLPEGLLYYLDNIIKVDESTYKYIAPIHPVNGEQIFYILQYIIGYFESNQKLRQKLTILTLLTYILNVKDISQNIVDLLSPIADYNNDFSQIFKCLKLPLDKRWEAICDKRVIKVIYEQGTIFYQVKIENQLKSQNQIDDHYQDCLFEWENIRRQNNLLEFKVNKIKRQWKLFKLNNQFYKERIVKNPQILNLNFEPHLNKLINKSKWSLVLEEVKSIRELLLQTVYGTRIDNPVDFHYLSQQFGLLNEKEQQCYIILAEYFQLKIGRESFQQQYQSISKEIQEFKLQFLKWQENNIKFESEINELLVRNRSILAMKWAKQTAGINQLQIYKNKKLATKQSQK